MLPKVFLLPLTWLLFFTEEIQPQQGSKVQYYHTGLTEVLCSLRSSYNPPFLRAKREKLSWLWGCMQSLPQVTTSTTETANMRRLPEVHVVGLLANYTTNATISIHLRWLETGLTQDRPVKLIFFNQPNVTTTLHLDYHGLDVKQYPISVLVPKGMSICGLPSKNVFTIPEKITANHSFLFNWVWELFGNVHSFSLTNRTINSLNIRLGPGKLQQDTGFLTCSEVHHLPAEEQYGNLSGKWLHGRRLRPRELVAPLGVKGCSTDWRIASMFKVQRYPNKDLFIIELQSPKGPFEDKTHIRNKDSVQVHIDIRPLSNSVVMIRRHVILVLINRTPSKSHVSWKIWTSGLEKNSTITVAFSSLKSNHLNQVESHVTVTQTILPSYITEFESGDLIRNVQQYYGLSVTSYVWATGPNYFDIRLESYGQHNNDDAIGCGFPEKTNLGPPVGRVTIPQVTNQPIIPNTVSALRKEDLRKALQVHCSSERLVVAALRQKQVGPSSFEFVLSENDDTCSLHHVPNTNLYLREVGADRCGTKQSFREGSVVLENKVILSVCNAQFCHISGQEHVEVDIRCVSHHTTGKGGSVTAYHSDFFLNPLPVQSVHTVGEKVFIEVKARKQDVKKGVLVFAEQCVLMHGSHNATFQAQTIISNGCAVRQHDRLPLVKVLSKWTRSGTKRQHFRFSLNIMEELQPAAVVYCKLSFCSRRNNLHAQYPACRKSCADHDSLVSKTSVVPPLNLTSNKWRHSGLLRIRMKPFQMATTKFKVTTKPTPPPPVTTVTSRHWRHKSLLPTSAGETLTDQPSAQEKSKDGVQVSVLAASALSAFMLGCVATLIVVMVLRMNRQKRNESAAVSEKPKPSVEAQGTIQSTYTPVNRSQENFKATTHITVPYKTSFREDCRSISTTVSGSTTASGDSVLQSTSMKKARPR